MLVALHSFSSLFRLCTSTFLYPYVLWEARGWQLKCVWSGDHAAVRRCARPCACISSAYGDNVLADSDCVNSRLCQP